MDSKTIAANVADLPFAKEIGIMVLDKFQTDLIENAKKNWCDSQVKMLEALIKSTSLGAEYGDVFYLLLTIKSHTLIGLKPSPIYKVTGLYKHTT